MVRRVIGRVVAGHDLCQGAQGRHRRRPRLCTINRGASINGCAENCAARGDLVEMLALRQDLRVGYLKVLTEPDLDGS